MNNAGSLHKSASRRSRRNGRTSTLEVPDQRACSWPAGKLEVLALVVIALLLILGALSAGQPRSAPPSWSEVQVRAGDSLWTLAVTHPVEGLTTAQVVDLVARDNRLEGRDIVPGDTILVPSESVQQRLASR